MELKEVTGTYLNMISETVSGIGIGEVICDNSEEDKLIIEIRSHGYIDNVSDFVIGILRQCEGEDLRVFLTGHEEEGTDGPEYYRRYMILK